MKLNQFILKLGKFTSIDYHIGITLLLRIWTIIAGGILILLIPLFLSAAEQGYYFTFSSLIALQVFFELGFNYVVVQMVGHEMANVSIDKFGRLDGQKSSVFRIYSLIILLKKWYLVISTLFFILVFSAGLYFFYYNGNLPLSSWLPAWTLLVLFSSINLFISPLLAVLEGIGFVGQVATIRLLQSIVGYGLFFILIILKFGLISIFLISGVAALFSFVWIKKNYRHILFERELDTSFQGERISWKREIFPFQWRIALSWLSGYFIFQLFSPMLFIHQGAIEAGKIGLTLQVFSTMLALSMSWMTAKSPVMARLVAEKRRIELNTLFRSLLVKSGFLNLIMSLLFFGLVLTLKNYGFNISERVASIDIILMLCFTSIINHAVFSMAFYMRSHKEEPMIWNSLIVGILTLLLIYYFSKISVFLTIASYSLVMTIVCLPWCFLLFRRYYSRHS